MLVVRSWSRRSSCGADQAARRNGEVLCELDHADTVKPPGGLGVEVVVFARWFTHLSVCLLVRERGLLFGGLVAVGRAGRFDEDVVEDAPRNFRATEQFVIENFIITNNVSNLQHR